MRRRLGEFQVIEVTWESRLGLGWMAMEKRATVRVLAHAPAELTEGRLRRLGEGIGKVVYASRHWVVKRERSQSEIMALIVIWKLVRRLERILPGDFGKRLLQHPSRQIRLLRMMLHPIVLAIPKSFWYATHAGEVLRVYAHRDERGEGLAEAHLAGTSLVPERVEFPPVRLRVGGWPGWLTVSEATERVEDTLYHRLAALAGAGQFDEMELWLNRFLDLRQAGWQCGVFSVDAHLKNFGVSEDRVVLLDAGGLTNHWADIEGRLAREDRVEQPHVELGLGAMLAARPDVAERFNARWKATVNVEEVRRHWPEAGVSPGR